VFSPKFCEVIVRGLRIKVLDKYWFKDLFYRGNCRHRWEVDYGKYVILKLLSIFGELYDYELDRVLRDLDVNAKLWVIIRELRREMKRLGKYRVIEKYLSVEKNA